MPTNYLSPAVDAWTVQAAAASRYLARLYRALGDGKQAANAISAGSPAEERAQRLGLSARISASQTAFMEKCPSEEAGEAQAWENLIEAHAGICAFHAMVDGQSEKSHGLLGARNVAVKAFCRSLQGFRVAFPEQMANEGIAKAIRAATDTCTSTFLADINETNQEDRSAISIEVHQVIQDALFAEAGLTIVGESAL